ncbi:MAG: hypothetical protein KGL39_50845 [Patescibacteria group bacterium]|nr:hypothetical protein [Patescibacteria group bacterium]
MPTPRLSEAKAKQYIEAVETALKAGHPPPGEVISGKLGAIYEAAAVLGKEPSGAMTRYRRCAEIYREADWTLWTHPTIARRMALRAEVSAPPIPDIAKPPEGFIVSRNSGSYDADGNLLRQSVRTVRDSGEPFEVRSGHMVKGESALLDPDGRVLAKWVKTREDGTGYLIEGLREAFEEYRGGAPVAPAPDYADDDLLTVYPLPDLHIGLYAWGSETGQDYDTDIAVREAKRAVATLVANARPSKHAIILGLGDYFHVNDAKAVTPISGHKQDMDGRWPRVYAAGAKLALAIVETVAAKHEQIEVAFLPGNHDLDAAATLTVAMSLFFENAGNVSVTDDPGLFWYRQFGKVLLGATHGHTMKPDKMAMALANDCSEQWGTSAFRHFFFGHVHHESAKEVAGVRVESFNAPVARDAWTNGAGFRSGRSMSAITFHRNDGEIARHRVNLRQPPSRIRVKARKG